MNTSNPDQNQVHGEHPNEPQALKFSKTIGRCVSKAREAHVDGLTPFEIDLIQSSIGRVAVAVQDAVSALRVAKEAAGGAAATKPRYTHVSQLNPDLMAYIALNTLFVSVVFKGTLHGAIESIGEQIEMEVWRMDFQNADPAHFERLVTLAKESADAEGNGSEEGRTEALKIVGTKEHPPYVAWSTEYRVRVGRILLNAVLASTSIFEYQGETSDERQKP